MSDQPDMFGGASSGLRHVLQENIGQFRDGFPAWLEENRHVWERFVDEANKLRDRGRKHYSARTIVEVLRHESALSDAGVEWKLNDHNTPDLARLYLLTHPGAEGFFETRVLKKSTRQGATE